MLCSLFCFFLFFPLWLRWRLYVYEGNFNHFEHKLCKTKPNSEMLKMNLTCYITNDYEGKSTLLKMQKQSQTNPIEPNLYCVYSWSNSKQTQNKPKFLPAALFGGLVRLRRVNLRGNYKRQSILQFFNKAFEFFDFFIVFEIRFNQFPAKFVTAVV
jgi:hypothetical protein